jgi:GntR family transcriptional regulator
VAVMADDGGSDRLNRVGGLPLHRQLADRLRGQILDGHLPPGSRLPTEAELGQRYGVTRPTIRQAVAQLRAEGWIQTRQGAGSFVREQPAPAAIEIQPEVHADPSGRVLVYRHHPPWGLLAPTRIAREPAGAEVARRLGLDPGGRVLVRDRLIGPVPDGPVRQLATTYLPARLAAQLPALTRRDPGPGGFLAVLAEAGYRTRTTLTVGSRMPLPDEAVALQLGPGRPLLVLWRTTYNREDNRPLEATRYALDGDGWEVTVPLLDRRGPLAGTPDPGPAPEPPGANAMGVIEPAHEDGLNDDG